MIHPSADPKLTVRAVYIIDPQKKIRASIVYPPSVGRNFNEVLRLLDSLQLTDAYKVATPVNWTNGDDVIIAPSLQDPAEIARLFPKGYRALKPYLRVTPQPDKV
jgi:alkyl hydroperoxide reductase subunit AhpC